MGDSETVNRGPRVVHADNAGPFAVGGTRTHLVGHHRLVVVDPGPDDPEHRERLVAEIVGGGHAGRAPAEVRVVVTHDHPDHDEGTTTLMASLGATGRLSFVELLGHTNAPDARVPADGALIPCDGGHLVALETPGHARRHLSLHQPDTDTLYPGDLVMGEGRTAWVGAYGGCVADYLASLDRLLSLEAHGLRPAHGPPVLGRDAVRERLELFRDHRLQRVAEVARAVEEMGVGVSMHDLLGRVYGTELPPALAEGATLSLHATLHHLGLRPFPTFSPEGSS